MLARRRYKRIDEPAAPFPLTASAVTVVHNDDRLLDAASLSIEPGEYVALTGPNGSGKTTLLNILASRGFRDRRPDQGSVRYGKLPVYDLSASARATLRSSLIAYVGQNPKAALFPEHSVATNLSLSARLRRRRINQAVLAEVINWYGFANLLGRPARTLSGGQQQLVALARAELTDPPLLLLDEPLAPLSPEMAQRVRERCHLLARRGKVVISIEHQLDPDIPRVIRMRHGRLEG